MIDSADKSAKKWDFSWIMSLFFDWEEERKFPVAGWICIIIFYLAGIIIWGVLFDWLGTPLNFHDWEEINFSRFEIVRNALNDQQIPLHVNCADCLHGVTDRFFVLPDVVTTPQMLVLPKFNNSEFFLLDLLLNYTVATFGLLYIRYKFNLSLVAYAVLFFLFNFNGYIQAHYVVGHATWAGYFLFPWFFILIFHFLEHGGSFLWVAGMAFLSLYIVLAGSQHHFTWMMLFFVFLSLSYWREKKWIITAILLSGLVSAVRLLPPVLAINTYTSGSSKFGFLSGYPTLYDFISALVDLHQIGYFDRIMSHRLGYWEFDYFIGVAGAAFLIFFGLFHWLRDQRSLKRFSPLLLPTALMFLLAQGNLYGQTLFKIPLLASERVPARMVSLPLTLLMIIAAVYFQEFLNANKDGIFRWLTGFFLLLMFNDIYMHTVFWRVDRIVKFFKPLDTGPIAVSIVNHADPQYVFVLAAGLALTLSSSSFIVFMSVRERLKRRLQL